MADTNNTPSSAKAEASTPAAAPKTETPASNATPAKSAEATASKAKTAARKPARRNAKRVKAASKPARTATAAKTRSTIKRNLNEGTRKMKNEANKAADRAQAVFGDVNERTRTVVAKSAKVAEGMTELTKGNVEAIVESSKIAAKGIENLGQGAADYGRRSFEEASAVLKSFAEVKSPTEFFKLQGDFARSAFDSWVSESSKASEAVIKLAGQVAEPITSRYSAASERVKTLAL